jgi:hypothetical protein
LIKSNTASKKAQVKTYNSDDSTKPKPNVKLDSNTLSSSSSSESELEIDGEMDESIEEGIRIAHLKPRFLEFTHVFPAFPKTHPEGYAYIIELSLEVLNEKSLVQLCDALQYSLMGGS